MRVLPGETALAFYTATNKSSSDIIGVATYSVTPGQAAPYFSKIQCFCFEEQKLNAGESVDMPVFFFIDPDFATDPNMRGIDTITLAYTFFSKMALLAACLSCANTEQRQSTTIMGSSSLLHHDQFSAAKSKLWSIETRSWIKPDQVKTSLGVHRPSVCSGFNTSLLHQSVLVLYVLELCDGLKMSSGNI